MKEFRPDSPSPSQDREELTRVRNGVSRSFLEWRHRLYAERRNLNSVESIDTFFVTMRRWVATEINANLKGNMGSLIETTLTLWREVKDEILQASNHIAQRSDDRELQVHWNHEMDDFQNMLLVPLVKLRALQVSTRTELKLTSALLIGDRHLSESNASATIPGTYLDQPRTEIEELPLWSDDEEI